MDHKTSVFQILRTQIITNMSFKGWSRAQCWEKYQWISQHLGPRRLKSYPARTQKGRSGQLGCWIPSLYLSSHKRPIVVHWNPPVGIFSLISCQISDLVLVLPQQGSDPWQHPHPVFSELLPMVSGAFFTFQGLRHGLEGPPGSRQRTVPAVGLQHHWASRKAHKGASCNIHTPSEHILCVPVGFGWGHSWPRTRRQTHFQNPARVPRALQGTGWKTSLRTTPTLTHPRPLS